MSWADLAPNLHARTGGSHASALVFISIDADQAFEADTHKTPRAATAARKRCFPKFIDAMTKQYACNSIPGRELERLTLEEQLLPLLVREGIKSEEAQDVCSAWKMGWDQDGLPLVRGQEQAHAGWPVLPRCDR